MLYSPQLLRAINVEVIEDFVEIRKVNLGFRLDRPIQKVYQITSGEELEFEFMEGLLKLKVPAFTVHTAIVLEY